MNFHVAMVNGTDNSFSYTYYLIRDGQMEVSEKYFIDKQEEVYEAMMDLYNKGNPFAYDLAQKAIKDARAYVQAYV